MFPKVLFYRFYGSLNAWAYFIIYLWWKKEVKTAYTFDSFERLPSFPHWLCSANFRSLFFPFPSPWSHCHNVYSFPHKVIHKRIFRWCVVLWKCPTFKRLMGLFQFWKDVLASSPGHIHFGTSLSNFLVQEFLMLFDLYVSLFSSILH